MNLIKKFLAAQTAVLALWAVGAQAASDEAIAKSLKPVGEVCLAGDASCGGGAAAAGGGARSGDAIVTSYCGSCHGAGVLDPSLGGGGGAGGEHHRAQCGS